AWVAVSEPGLLKDVALAFSGKPVRHSEVLDVSDAFGLWLAPQKEGVQFSGAFHGRDEKQAKELYAFLSRSSPKEMNPRIEGGPAAAKDAPPAETLWIYLQMHANPQRLRE